MDDITFEHKIKELKMILKLGEDIFWNIQRRVEEGTGDSLPSFLLFLLQVFSLEGSFSKILIENAMFKITNFFLMSDEKLLNNISISIKSIVLIYVLIIPRLFRLLFICDLIVTTCWNYICIFIFSKRYSSPSRMSKLLIMQRIQIFLIITHTFSFRLITYSLYFYLLRSLQICNRRSFSCNFLIKILICQRF